MAEEKEPKKAAPKQVDFGDRTVVTFVSNGKSKHMPDGNEYDITTEMAQLFLNKKYGDVKL